MRDEKHGEKRGLWEMEMKRKGEKRERTGRHH